MRAFGAPGSLGTLGEEGEVCKRIRWDRIREKDTWVRNLRFFLGRVKGGWIVPHVIRRGILDSIEKLHDGCGYLRYSH